MTKDLNTDRLRLTPFDFTDADLLHRTFTDPFVRKYLWDDEKISLEQAREIHKKSMEHFARDGWGLWKILVQPDETFAGFAGLWIFFDEKQPQLPYGVLPEKAKLGYATEAARAVTNFAFETLGFKYLIASCDAVHGDSRRVCDRLGMQLVGDKVSDGKLLAHYRIDAPII